MRSTAFTAVLAAVAVLAAATAAQASDFATGDKPAPAGQAVRGVLGKAPHGYALVTSGLLTAVAGTQTHGLVSCPAGSVPFGGGVFVAAVSTDADVNSSYPTATGWSADINNGTASSTTFTVYATCAAKPRKYQLVDGGLQSVHNAAQTTLTASCPAGETPLGGGAFSSSNSAFVNLNSSYPTQVGWHVDVDDAAGESTTAAVRLVCGKLKNVSITAGPVVTNPAGDQTGAELGCPHGVVVGGGVWSGSTDFRVTTNSSFPRSNGWVAYENNASPADTGMQVSVICVG